MKNYRTTCLALLAVFFCNLVQADPFLEPAKLSDNLHQLNFEDSRSGKTVTVRLDENHLPLRQDFFDEEVSIPFYIEGILVDSSSGSRLHAWEVVPKSNPNGIYILMLHGNGGNILSNLGGGVALAKRGFKVNIVDYSGYGYSTGEATRENLLEDAESTLGINSAERLADDEKLALYGQSLGGHLAVVVAARNSEKIDALAIEGAFSSHRAMAFEARGLLGRAFSGEPYSALESITEYTKPILVIHSRDDEVVPFEKGQELFAAANEPMMFFEIEQPHLAGLALYADPIAGKIAEMVTTGEATGPQAD